MREGLRDIRVIDFSSQIAGPYCTKLFADAGADVVKVESDAGDPLRRWSASGVGLGERDGALFRFLNAGKRSVVGTPDDTRVETLLAGADLVVDDFGAGDRLSREALARRHPGLVILSISPYGLDGPYARRPATEFTLQAECSSIGVRGLPGREPYQAGGRTTEWIGGTYAAVAALAALYRARRSGHGERIDFSLHEVMGLATNNFIDLMWGLFGRPPVIGSAQNVETPSIEPTADGYIGFNTNTAQQLQDFLLLIEQPELRESGDFNLAAQRLSRLAAWEEIIHAYTTQHTTAEIIERASALRIPVAPVCNGETVLRQPHLEARGVYSEDSSGGFQRPRPPYKIDGASPPQPRPAPRLGEHDGKIEARSSKRPAPHGAPALPLRGLRVIDMTSWWAGPAASHMIATLGADVIHIESVAKPDGARMVGHMFAQGGKPWWECSTFFLSANTNKRGLTLDLDKKRGIELFNELLASADVLIENFSPRVMEGFGFTAERVRAINPHCIYVRMPAFGLDGPWRDHVGFAQTMEQISGLAWLTGHDDDHPRIQRGPCDPLAGMHAAFALLVALVDRERSGVGAYVECTMVEGALNAAAEQVIEWTAYGNLMHRQGNRSPTAAPQGLYACAEHDAAAHPRWLALSVENDREWQALLTWLGEPEWARDLRAAPLLERRRAHERIDTELRSVFAARDRDECVAQLVAAGIPAAPLVDPRSLSDHPQLRHRGFFEEIEHPVIGVQRFMTVPFRYASVDRWLRCAAPRIGEHNSEILSELGLSADEIRRLEKSQVIGNRPTHS